MAEFTTGGPAGDASLSPLSGGGPLHPNSASVDAESGYPTDDSAENIRPGFYFDEVDVSVRYWEEDEAGERAASGHPWLFLSEDRSTSRERLEELIRARGFGGLLDGLVIDWESSV